MDFFAAQDNARRTTRWLVVGFALAIAAIITVLYLTVIYCQRFGTEPPPPWWNGEQFFFVTLFTGGIILGGSLYKLIQLARGGGAMVAMRLGGRPVQRGSIDPLEQRLLNVTEEMALASGIAIPAVYVLDNEQGINAFAAGNTLANSVIAVTRGALQQLSRDELQAVVAHEFSHILNGDMRLNMRLLGILHGLLLLHLTGEKMLEIRRGGSATLIIVLGGLLLLLLGYIGVVFGKIIKAAVSRQREFLADASAVQFTRNPLGLSGALRRIADTGSKIRHPGAEEASHMFFSSEISGLARLLATHPPIEERIRRLDPKYLRRPLASPSQNVATAKPAADDSIISGFSPQNFTAAVGDISDAPLDYTHALLQRLPVEISQAVHQLPDARTVVFALLLSASPQTREKQLQALQQQYDSATARQGAAYARWLSANEPALRLPVFDMAISTLQETPGAERARLLQTAEELLAQEDKMPLSKYILRTLLRQSLQPDAAKLAPAVTMKTLKSDSAQLLALLAFIGSSDEVACREAFIAATAQAPFDGPWPTYAPPQELSVEAIDRILNELATTQAGFRKHLINACATAVNHDNRITYAEAELLRAICKALDCPVPPPFRYASA